MPYVNLVTKLTPSSPNMPLFITVREVYSKPAGQIHAHTYPVLLQRSSICYWSCGSSSGRPGSHTAAGPGAHNVQAGLL